MFIDQQFGRRIHPYRAIDELSCLNTALVLVVVFFAIGVMIERKEGIFLGNRVLPAVSAFMIVVFELLVHEFGFGSEGLEQA